MTPNSQNKKFIEKLTAYGLVPYHELGQRIYKYTSIDSAIKIIESTSLKFSLPKDFNDPFEMTNELIDTSYKKNDIRNWFLDFEQYSKNRRKALFNDFNRNGGNIHNAFEQTFEVFKANTGICCFSRSNIKTLMWSHYADKHAGVCLGFDIFPLNVGEFFLFHIAYADKIKPLNYFRDKHAVLFNWIFTKSKVWEYEQEVRAVFTNRSGLIPFEKNCLKEIYFGLKTSDEEKSILLNKLHSLEYKMSKVGVMTMNPSTFDLKIESYNS